MTRREQKSAERDQLAAKSPLKVSEQIVHERAKWHLLNDRKMIAYYNQHWPGVTRGRLQKLSKEAESFYRAAYNRPRVLEVIPRALNDWESMSDEEMLSYYRAQWPGISRGKLPSVSSAASAFYQAASQRPGVFDAIARARTDWASMTDQQMIEHYNKHWPGVSRGKLQILSNESCTFYEAAYKRPQVLAAIVRVKRNWTSMTDEQMIDYYRQHWPQVSRGSLYRHSSESKAFYKAAQSRPNVLEAIPTARMLAKA